MPGIPGIIIICTEKNIAHDVYNTETNLTPLYAWEKVSNSRGLGKIFLPKLNHPYPPPPEKSNGQPHRGWERSRLCTLVDVIMWWFSRPKFSHFKFENTPMKDTNGKKKFEKMLRFLFVDAAFHYEIVFRGIQPCFLRGRSESLACFEPTEAARFLKKREILSALYGQGKHVF